MNEAFKFAKERHQNTKRKYSGEPYIIHLQAVHQLVRQVTDDKDTWTAAILHDVIEDTDTTYEEVQERFGKKVADIVQECTKDKEKNFHIKSKEALVIKMADVMHNLGSNDNPWYIEKMLYLHHPNKMIPKYFKRPEV